MADNTLTGAGVAVATDKVTYSSDADQNLQLMRPVHVTGAEGSKTVQDITGPTGSAVPPAAVMTGGSDGTNLRAVKVDASGVQQVSGSMVTVKTDVTRPADTTAYAVNDALSNSTSAPTSGGFTFAGAARASGGSGIITDAFVVSSADPGTQLQGELFIFDQAVTNPNDNAAFAITDAEAKTLIGIVPFTLEDIGNNGYFHAKNLNIGFTCVGSADLRFLVRVKNAYTPANAEVLTFALKVVRID